MIVNKSEASKIAKGVLMNSMDIGYWNALEYYCRDQEMTFQIMDHPLPSV